MAASTNNFSAASTTLPPSGVRFETSVILVWGVLMVVGMLWGHRAQGLWAGVGALAAFRGLRNKSLTPATWGFAGFAVWALVQVWWPRSALPVSLQVPDWSEPLLGEKSLYRSLTPWKAWTWAMLFAGAALWAQSFDGDRLYRRRLGVALRVTSLVAAILVLQATLLGGFWPPGLSENHAGLLCVLAVPEVLTRAWSRHVGLQIVLVTMVAGAVAAGAVYPVLLAGVVLAMMLPWRERYGAAIAVTGVAAVCGLGWGVVNGLLDDFIGRGAIWAGTVAMVREDFGFGAGFGAFPWVFPAYAQALPFGGARALHPENGYLWLLATGGWPVVLMVVAAIAFCRRRRGEAARGLRWAAAMVLAAGLVDVPWLSAPLFWSLPLLWVGGWQGRWMTKKPAQMSDA